MDSRMVSLEGPQCGTTPVWVYLFLFDFLFEREVFHPRIDRGGFPIRPHSDGVKYKFSMATNQRQSATSELQAS